MVRALGYNNQFPKAPCASSESRGVIEDALHIQVEKPIPPRVLPETLFTSEFKIQIPHMLSRVVDAPPMDLANPRASVVKPGDVHLDPSYRLGGRDMDRPYLAK